MERKYNLCDRNIFYEAIVIKQFNYNKETWY